jgi:alkanesulfonate monooxygenase SsuD/methylene tetrahydromethanopterin reductase-like flavin-dependent oxidoreductase (luciferase family)
MQFSIFSVADHYPEESRTIRELYAQILDEIELADELGFSAFFLAEHQAERVRASLKRFAREVMPNFVESGSISAS